MTRFAATCPTCQRPFTGATQQQVSDQMWTHDEVEHRGMTAIHQLADVGFYDVFCQAVAAMPIGHRFTTADLHGVVPDPPDHHWWGKAQGEARRRGLCRKVGSQPSALETTKDSLVRQWERCAASERRVA